jgi:DnaK suppressor protein
VNEQEMKPFETQLHAMRDGLLEQIALQRDGMPQQVDATAAHFSHPEDSHAQMISAKDLEFALGEQERAELAAVQAALQRIASGVYGQCVDCGQRIPQARLQASPEVARCIRCQQAAELESAAF